ncbi:ABC transporter ATP-binding protein [bacterium]|nr:MAG: ABC transporter ATP-binding protein [bacterium]
MAQSGSATVDAKCAGPLLSVQGLTKLFGGVAAVSQVSFDLAPGKLTGLIGPNGSGKSTTINLMSGLHRPTRGAIYYRGENISNLPPHRIARLGIVRTFQLLRLFGDLSAFENVLVGAHLRGKNGFAAACLGPLKPRTEEQQLHQIARDALEFVGLGGRGEIKARLLTSGEGRLLELARAIAADPELILLDEPAAGLNTAETTLLAEKLLSLVDRGKTLLLVDHHMSLVMSVASSVIVLAGGQVLTIGTPQEVQADPRVVESYLGSGEVYRRRRAKRGVSEL